MMKFRDIGLTVKISMVVLIPYSLGVLVAGSTGYLSYVNTQLLREFRFQSRIAERAATINASLVELRESGRDLLATNDKNLIERNSNDLKLLRESVNSLKKDLGDKTNEAKMLLESLESLKSLQSNVVKSAVVQSSSESAGVKTEALAVGIKAKQQFENLGTLVAKLAHDRAVLAEDRLRRAEWNSRLAYNILFWGMIVIVVTALVLIYVVSKRIVKPIQQAVALAEATSNGDLTRILNIEGSDEVGRLSTALDSMVERLKTQIKKILDAVNILSTSASEISTTVSEVSRSTSMTSTSVTETTTTVAQVKQAAEVASQKSKDVARMANESVRVSSEGREATKDTIDGMNLIKDQMESVGETVVRLSEQSQEIEQIIVAVQDLADQSNLLAVNASIEAARAGDHGKGFTVVAHEIKSLADQSREATEQVRSILQDTRKWVSAVVMATEQGTKAVHIGVEQSIRAGEAIGSLNSNVVESAQAASVIETTSEQQFAGVDQVSTAMAGIENAMHQNLTSTKQLASEADRLAALGNQLKELVADYKF